MDARSPMTAPFLEGLQPLLDACACPRPGEPPESASRRARALGSFRREGLPDRTWEAWSHSDPSFLWEKRFEPSPASAFRIMNGLPEGVRSGGEGPFLSPEEDFSGRPVASLQEVLAGDALVLRVPRGVRAGETLHLGHSLLAGRLTVPTLILVLEKGASLDASLVHEGVPGSFGLPAVRAVLAEGARLSWNEDFSALSGASQISLFDAVLHRDARLESATLQSGGGWARHDLRVRLAGPGARVSLKGLLLARGDQRMDLHTFVDHESPGGISEQLFKGVVDERAAVVYNGEVLVREGAKGTDARQTNRNLVLSDEAGVVSQPRLEIHHDDVRCTHGSATGPLDEESVFYLRTRGLGEAEARRFILHAFVSEVFGAQEPPGRTAEEWLLRLEKRS